MYTYIVVYSTPKIFESRYSAATLHVPVSELVGGESGDCIGGAGHGSGVLLQQLPGISRMRLRNGNYLIPIVQVKVRQVEEF